MAREKYILKRCHLLELHTIFFQKTSFPTIDPSAAIEQREPIVVHNANLAGRRTITGKPTNKPNR